MISKWVREALKPYNQYDMFRVQLKAFIEMNTKRWEEFKAEKDGDLSRDSDIGIIDLDDDSRS